ncbi:DUF904 domain-containing protein [Pseudoalteromonas fenneropenaei]|uniref:DUF904 domain-containing protein n=1 Tax=Pseudoalteromonas fenneropenaei TaxID=1737459 RepID=A0ABV7CLR2_9GAMM
MNDILPQLEQLIEQLLQKNQQLNQEVQTLQEQVSKLIDENETLQLEVLDNEEKQKDTSTALAGLLAKLQSAQQA